MASSVKGVTSLPARSNRFLADAPGTTVQLAGVLDGHRVDNIWVICGTAAAPPATVGDFATTGYSDHLLNADSVNARYAAGLEQFTATISGVTSGGSPGDQVYIALVSQAAGSGGPGGGLAVLVTDGPYSVGSPT